MSYDTKPTTAAEVICPACAGASQRNDTHCVYCGTRGYVVKKRASEIQNEIAQTYAVIIADGIIKTQMPESHKILQLKK
jgi:uncharacterized paraquat-inducible protein A